MKIYHIFRPFFPRDDGERVRGTRYEVQYHTDGAALPHMARRLSSRVPTTRPTMVYERRCVCASELCRPLLLGHLECARISEGAIFEMSSRRARDLRSAVVASIITATIVPVFIGISIKAARVAYIF